MRKAESPGSKAHDAKPAKLPDGKTLTLSVWRRDQGHSCSRYDDLGIDMVSGYLQSLALKVDPVHIEFSADAKQMPSDVITSTHTQTLQVAEHSTVDT